MIERNAKQLRVWRAQQGWTQDDASAYLFRSRVQYNRYEMGRQIMPDELWEMVEATYKKPKSDK